MSLLLMGCGSAVDGDDTPSPTPPNAPTIIATTPDATLPLSKLTTTFTDNASDEDGFEVRSGSTNVFNDAVFDQDLAANAATYSIAELDEDELVYSWLAAYKTDGMSRVYSDWQATSGTTASSITLNDTNPLVLSKTEDDTGTVVNLTAPTDANGPCTPTIADDGAGLAMSGLGVVTTAPLVPGVYAPIVTFTDDTYPSITADQNITLTVKPLAPTLAFTDNHDGSADLGITNESTAATHFEGEFNYTPSGGDPSGWSPLASGLIGDLAPSYNFPALNAGDFLQSRFRVKIIDGGDIWSDYGTDGVTISI